MAIAADARELALRILREGGTNERVCRVTGLTWCQVRSIRKRAFSRAAPPTVAEIFVRSTRGATDDEIAREFGCTVKAVRRRRKAACRTSEQAYLPNLNEIASICLRIQATWSDAERERRRMQPGGLVRWTLPTVSADPDAGIREIDHGDRRAASEAGVRCPGCGAMVEPPCRACHVADVLERNGRLAGEPACS